MNNLLTATAVGLLFASFSFGQTNPQILPDTTSPKVEAKQSEKMSTLFSELKNPLKKLHHVGLSMGSEIIYGGLAGQFTPMAGVTGMLHLNKKWGIGLAGYSTIDDGFAPTKLNSTKALSLSNMYGGIKLEYTPKPDAVVHVSFPLLIGGGMAKIDSISNEKGRDMDNNGGRHNENEANGRNNNYGGDVSYFVIQPGINVETNVLRYAKVFLGLSYRIVPTVMAETMTTSMTMLPTPTAAQLSGLNVTAGVRIGLFDYALHQPRKSKNKKQGRSKNQ